MTRKDEIILEAADKAIDYFDENCFIHGFEEGVEWADSHPDWHNYKTDRNFPKDVILETTEGIFSAKYDDHLNQFYSGGEWIMESTIIAWMKLPGPSKFD